MSISKKTSVKRLGGRVEDFTDQSLLALMQMEGFDPAADGSEWALVVSDTHANCYYATSTIEPSIPPQLDKLAAENPPAMVMHLGDLLQEYVTWGLPPFLYRGHDEIMKSNVLLDRFAQLAPVKLILGNHDCHVKESPLGSFMLANCRFFDSLHHSFELGGVRCVMLSSTHDGALIQSEIDFLAAELAAVPPGQEVVIFMHHPSGGRASDHLSLPAMLGSVPSGMTNPLWHVAGHSHYYSQRTYALPSTTLAQWEIGAGAGHWVHFGPDYMPSMAAIAFRDGAVHSRYAWFGRGDYWVTQPDISRASPIPAPGLYDGLAGYTVLATYRQGLFDNAVHITNASGATTWKDNDSWLVYIIDVRVVFPIPVGATRFWLITEMTPPFIDMSADGITWTAVTVPALVQNACVPTIPVGLRGNANLHVRVKGVTAISAWGFAQ